MKIKTTYHGLNDFQNEPQHFLNMFPLTGMLMMGRYEQWRNNNVKLLAEFNKQLKQLEDDYCVKNADGVVQRLPNGDLIFRDDQMHREFDVKLKELLNTECEVII